MRNSNQVENKLRQIDKLMEEIRSLMESKGVANPYELGSGHYAGFEWARRKHVSSNASPSFVEGMEEYYRQLRER